MAIRFARPIGVFCIFLCVACTKSPTPEDAAAELTKSNDPAAELTTSNDPAAQELQQLFTDEWNGRLARNPLLASRMGNSDYDDRLPDMSPEAQRKILAEDLGYLTRLDAIDRSTLTQDDQTNYDLFRFIVRHRTTLAEYQQYKMPILSDSGFHMGIQRMYESMAFKTVEDYENYLSRLRALDLFFDQNIGNMRDG
ncbi:MAG: DUF885 family protein, partial [Woeseiaceae bacterium]